MNQLSLEYPNQREEPEEDYYSDLNRRAITLPGWEGTVTREAAEIAQTLSPIDNQTAAWLLKILEKGAVLVGNAVYDAAGHLLKKVPGKVVQLTEEIMKPKHRVANPVTKTKVKKKSPPKPTKALVPSAPTPANGVYSTSAPVSIGNTITGVATKSRPTKEGHIVRGREFLTTAYGSALSVINWTMVAGVPLTPVCFVDSLLRMYGAMYEFYKWKKLTVHYVTTSPTSTNGSVMVYYHKSREGVFLKQTSPNLLPFVLSDPHTCISPQWQNFSVNLVTDDDWKRCDYGYSADITHYAAGELFLLSKTTTADSPGYLLMDYELDFKGLNLTPRLLLWPQPTIVYTPYSMSTTSQTNNTAVELVFETGQAHNVFGNIPSALRSDGIYKVILDLGNTTGATAADVVWKSLTRSGAAGNTTGLGDGTTIYAVCVNGVTNFSFYVNATSAYTGSASELYLWNATGTDTTYYMMWFSLIGFTAGAAVNPNM